MAAFKHDVAEVLLHLVYPTNERLLKFKETKRFPKTSRVLIFARDLDDVILVSLLLTLNKFRSFFVSINDLERVNICWLVLLT